MPEINNQFAKPGILDNKLTVVHLSKFLAITATWTRICNIKITVSTDTVFLFIVLRHERTGSFVEIQC